MKYLELWERVKESGQDPKLVVHYGKHSVSGNELDVVPYNIVLRDGTYRIFGTDERQNHYPFDFSLEGADVEFSTEEEACEFIWERISRPQPAPGKLPKRTQAEKDAMHAEMMESIMRGRAAYFKEHGLDEHGQGGSEQK